MGFLDGLKDKGLDAAVALLQQKLGADIAKKIRDELAGQFDKLKGKGESEVKAAIKPKVSAELASKADAIIPTLLSGKKDEIVEKAAGKITDGIYADVKAQIAK